MHAQRRVFLHDPASAVLSLSTSLRVFGWIEAAYAVSGKTIRSSVTGSSRTVRVSPVEASSFGITPMSPRPMRGVGSCVLPRMNINWVMRSSRALREFQTWLSAFSVPENTRTYVIRPMYGSAIVLKASAASLPFARPPPARRPPPTAAA